MNIAFPAFLIFLIVLPGILFRYKYRKGFWRSPVQFGSLQDEIAYGVLFAIVFHLFAYLVIEKIGLLIQYDTVMILLTGWPRIGQDSIRNHVINATSLPHYILLYFLLLNSLAYLMGCFSHLSVRFAKLDLRFDFLRFTNEWYYIFTGEARVFDLEPKERSFAQIKQVLSYNIDLVYISAMVDHNKGTILYYGVLSDFFFDSKGKLEKIIIQAAQRRGLELDESLGEVKAERFYDIKGDYLAIRYEDIINLNIEYISLPDTPLGNLQDEPNR